MKVFISSLLALGVVIGHTQAASLLENVLPRPQTKYDSSKSLDIDSIDLDSLGNYDKDKEQSNYGGYNQDSSSSYDKSTYDKPTYDKPSYEKTSYDKKPSSYDLGESLLNTGNLYETLPLKNIGSGSGLGSLYKKSDLSDILGNYNQLHNLGGGNHLQNLYSTLDRKKGSLSNYDLLENLPLYANQDYPSSNLRYRLPNGQQLQCIALN